MFEFVKRLLRRKSAIIGFGIVIIFALLAILAPILTIYPNAYQPSAWYASTPYSMPSWIRYLPGFSHYSTTVYLPSNSVAEFKSPNSLTIWNLSLGGESTGVNTLLNTTYGPSGIQAQKLASTLINTGPGSLEIKAVGHVTTNITLTYTFKYKGLPTDFYTQFAVNPSVKGSGVVSIEAYLTNPSHKVFWILDSGTSPTLNSSTAFQPLVAGAWQLVTASTLSPSTMPWSESLSLTQLPFAPRLFAHQAFNQGGSYVFRVVLDLNLPQGSAATIYLSDLRIVVFGQTFGVLGTDNNGASVWSEFLYGARTSLLIGLIASVLIVAIGLMFGLIAGYFGGAFDMVLVAINDILLVIPFLPLLITLGALVFILHIAIGKVYLIIILITLLSWPGTARIIRSQTLSLKNRAYVKAAAGFGAGWPHIVFRHILPELAGILFAQLAIDVPAVIGIEAGLDFLGLGITSFPTWGNMIGFASTLFSAQNGFLWWWILPPGLGLTVLGISFYSLGEAVRQELAIKRR
ncbi:MAG: ABC transporter permease [Thermoprotei archaeon]